MNDVKLQPDELTKVVTVPADRFCSVLVDECAERTLYNGKVVWYSHISDKIFRVEDSDGIIRDL